MKILVATHHLADWGGTETYTLTLVKALQARGHDVTVYSPFPGVVSRAIEQEGIPFAREIATLRCEPFAVAHVHHNIVATQVRAALPDLPMVWVSHGVQPQIEQPPTFAPEVVLAVAPTILTKLRRAGLAAELVPNMIDTAWFTPTRPAASRPANALLLANQLQQKALVNTGEACRMLGIPISSVGRPGNASGDVREALEQADIVFAAGRSALEAAAMERPVILYGQFGCGGWLDRSGYKAGFDTGFSMRLTGRFLPPRELADLINNEYSRQKGIEAREVVVEHHGLDVVIPRLEEAYRRAIDVGLGDKELEPARLAPGLDEQLSIYQRELRELRSSRALMDVPLYRFVRRLARLLAGSGVYRAARRLDEYVSRLARR